MMGHLTPPAANSPFPKPYKPYLLFSFGVWNTEGVQLFFVFTYMFTSKNSPFRNKSSLKISTLSMPLFSIGILTSKMQMTSKFITSFRSPFRTCLLYLAGYRAPPWSKLKEIANFSCPLLSP